MNISRENTSELTATIKISIEPSDYSENVEKQILEYKKKANMPGFRPGHVPLGLIRKMYGKALLADEVNKLISKSLLDYIKDEKLDILGNPIPNADKNAQIDFEHHDAFDFYFDIGFTPSFTIPVDQDLNIPDYKVIIGEDMVDRYIMGLRKEHAPGKDKPTENMEEESDLKEPAEETTVTEKTDDSLAELNEVFFGKVYPAMEIKTEEEFRTQVRKDATAGFSADAEKFLFNNIVDALVKNTEMQLPDEFLKRWLVENNEGKYTPEEIELEYPSFVESMKWQLIENKLLKENNITVTDQEIRNYIATYMFRQINLDSMDPELQKRYESVIDTLMENKEQVQRINDQLYNAKMMEFFKANITLHPTEVTYEEFFNLLAARNHHGHRHDHHVHEHGEGHDHHDHDHDHDHDHEHEHTH